MSGNRKNSDKDKNTGLKLFNPLAATLKQAQINQAELFKKEDMLAIEKKAHDAAQLMKEAKQKYSYEAQYLDNQSKITRFDVERIFFDKKEHLLKALSIYKGEQATYAKNLINAINDPAMKKPDTRDWNKLLQSLASLNYQLEQSIQNGKFLERRRAEALLKIVRPLHTKIDVKIKNLTEIAQGVSSLKVKLNEAEANFQKANNEYLSMLGRHRDKHSPRLFKKELPATPDMMQPATKKKP